MALRTTRWSPDTCGCVVEYEWDDTTDEANRVHTPGSVVSRCAAHQGLASEAAVHAAVLDENPRKNKALEAVRKTLTKATKKNQDGEDVLDDSKVKWAFDANRDLEVSLIDPSFTAKDKSDALTAMQAAVGQKVKVK